MGRLSRRDFVKHAGLAGALGAGVVAHAHATGPAAAEDPHAAHKAAGASHGGLGTVGRVDHQRNGFDPSVILTDFDRGVVSKDASGRTVREYEFVATTKDIEVAPGIFFPAWTYNGRVPGPTIRATEGDRIRIRFTNTTPPPAHHPFPRHPPGGDGRGAGPR